MRVLLADDLDLVRDSLKLYLEQHEAIAQVHTARDLDQALSVADRDGPFDLILLDFRMPGMNGFEGLERMRAALPYTPLAILSAFTCTPEMVGDLARVRASFIPKTVSGPDLLRILRALRSGETYVPAGVAACTPHQHPAPTGKRLTQRERDVLSHLIHGLSNKEIARQLAIEEVTVRLHLRGIFRKMGVRNRTQAVKHALDHGLAY